MTDNYTCIIIDDEPKAASLLCDMVEQYYNNLLIIGVHTDWESAYNAIKAKQPDILFLDIQMPQKTGMDLLQLLPEIKSEIIFVTAYSDQALQAFDFAASGYILKPINDKVFVKTVDRSIERVHNKRFAEKQTIVHKSTTNKLSIPNNKGTDYVDINTIIYLEAINRYTKVIINDSSELLCSYNIGKFKEILTDEKFHQVHRSFIINLDHVKRYGSTGLVFMSNGAELPVSKSAKEDFLRLFAKITK